MFDCQELMGKKKQQREMEIKLICRIIIFLTFNFRRESQPNVFERTIN